MLRTKPCFASSRETCASLTIQGTDNECIDFFTNLTTVSIVFCLKYFLWNSTNRLTVSFHISIGSWCRKRRNSCFKFSRIFVYFAIKCKLNLIMILIWRFQKVHRKWIVTNNTKKVLWCLLFTYWQIIAALNSRSAINQDVLRLLRIN